MSKTFDIIHTETSEVRSIGYQLQGLSQAFNRTGNRQVSEELDELSSSLLNAAKAISDAYNSEQSAYVEQSLANSNRFIGSVFKSLLEEKDPKDALLESVKHHLDTDIIDAHKSGETT